MRRNPFSISPLEGTTMKNPFSVKEDRELFNRLSAEALLETDPAKKKELQQLASAASKKLFKREAIRGAIIGTGVATAIAGVYIVARNVLEGDEETEKENET